MKKAIIILTLLISLNAFSQDKSNFVSLQFSDKSVSLYPFYKTFSVGFTPAATITMDRDFFSKGNSNFLYSGEITWYAHKMIGSGLTPIINIGYRYQTNSGLYFETKLGTGGNFFYPARELFVLNEAGEYESKNILHTTIAGTAGLGVGYQLGKFAIYSRYSFMLEGRYNEFIQFLPTSTFGVGLKYQI